MHDAARGVPHYRAGMELRLERVEAMSFELKPLESNNVGREVVGLSLDVDISPWDSQALRDAWLEHGMLLFRQFGATPEQQIKLSRCFGELEPHPIAKFRDPDYPELILLTNKDGFVSPIYEIDGEHIYGRVPWHADLAFTTTPNAGALLRMVQKTERGGQTGWLDLALAYDTLDDATKVEIADLEAVYLFRAGLEEMRFNQQGGKRITPRNDNYPHFPPVVNPLVWVHPETGRKLLNVSTMNIDHIVGMDEAESDALIERLIAHALRPEFQYMHEWENGDMILWDNRRTLHCATGHPADLIRIVTRTTIKGTVAMGRVLVEATA